MTQKWITADGKEVDLYTICHQHLSNIYYYTHFILSESYPQSVRNKVVDALNSRFDGKALPYDPKFKWRKDFF